MAASYAGVPTGPYIYYVGPDLKTAVEANPLSDPGRVDLANLEEGIRRLAIALAGIAGLGWGLMMTVALITDGVEASEFALYGIGGALAIFGVLWGLVRVLGWAVIGFSDRD